MFPTSTILKLHIDYRHRIAELNFYKEEIRIFEHQLENIASTKTDHAVCAQVEHFQNQFIRQREVIDELWHTLHQSEKELAGFVIELSGLGLESIKLQSEPRLQEDMNSFGDIYRGLKKAFRQFVVATR